MIIKLVKYGRIVAKAKTTKIGKKLNEYDKDVWRVSHNALEITKSTTANSIAEKIKAINPWISDW